MNRKIILFPLAMAAILGLASCTSENPQPSNSEPETSQVPSSDEEVKKATITTNKTAIELTVGDTERITVTVENADNKNVSFASSDPTIATVDAAAGVVTAVKEGTAKITVTLDADNTVKAEVAVTVKAPELIKLSSVTGPVSAKNTYYGVITAKTSNGFVIDDGTGALYVCKTTSYNVGDYVSVTDSISAYFGLLETSFNPTIAKMEGTAPTLREATPLTKEIIDTVQAQVTDSAQSGGTTGFHLADMGPYSFKLPAVIDGSYTNFMLGDYKLSPMKYVGDRFQNGVTYTVKGYFAGWNSNGSYYQFIVTSAEPSYKDVESVNLDKNTLSITALGDRQSLVATVLPVGSNQILTWSSSNEAVATVKDGQVTSVGVGETTITATSVADPSKSASCVVTVSNVEMVSYTSLVKYDFSDLTYDGSKDDGYGALDASGVAALFANEKYKESGTNIVTACTESTKAYKAQSDQGPKKLGLKIGTTTLAGTISLTLSKNVAKVAIEAYGWNGKNLAKLTVGDQNYQYTSSDLGTAIKNDFIFAESSTVSISATKALVITGIEFFEKTAA